MRSGSYPRKSGEQVMAALNRVCKWRRIFSGKMVGTRPEGDPFIVGMNELQEARIIMRVELTALVGLLIRKGLFTEEEFSSAMGAEADLLNADYAARFPGFTAHNDGMHMEPVAMMETMKNQPWAK